MNYAEIMMILKLICILIAHDIIEEFENFGILLLALLQQLLTCNANIFYSNDMQTFL